MCSTFLVSYFWLMWPIQFSLLNLMIVTMSTSSHTVCNSQLYLIIQWPLL
jgi:hypothetical protein